MLKIQTATRASRNRENGCLILTIGKKCYHLSAVEESALRRWAARLLRPHAVAVGAWIEQRTRPKPHDLHADDWCGEQGRRR